MGNPKAERSTGTVDLFDTPGLDDSKVAGGDSFVCLTVEHLLPVDCEGCDGCPSVVKDTSIVNFSAMKAAGMMSVPENGMVDSEEWEDPSDFGLF